MPRTAANRPNQPWAPDSLHVFPINRKVTKPRPRADGGGRSEAKERPCWDLRWRVDGKDFSRRFYRAADATTWAEQLRAGHLRGWPFDPDARRFTPPESATKSEERDTVFTWTQEYWDLKWRTLEPRGRPELARYLNRARRYFVTAQPAAKEAEAVEDYLRSASLSVRPEPPTERQSAGESWLRAHSLALDAVDRRQLEAFLAEYRQNQRDPTKQVSPSSERRMVADLRQCWARAVREERLDANPWDKIDLRTRAASGGTTRSGRSALAADAELVLAPEQVWELAEACGEIGSWGRVTECYVLVMGLCGLRPNEAVGLVIGDLELPETGPGWLTVRRSRRRVPERYLDHEDDPEWGPLKGRDLAATRRVPVPTQLNERLRAHLDEFRAHAQSHDLVFVRNDGPFDLSAFHNDVWAPARAALFPAIADLPLSSPLQPKLSRLRRHDLRHSACSLWLRSRVDVSVCQRWSGHKQLSVFLDIYQGLIPGREEEGVRLLDDQLRVELRPVSAADIAVRTVGTLDVSTDA